MKIICKLLSYRRYLCEKGENRILKFLLNEGNCGNYTVFHQFNGRVGPSSICLSHRLLFVSLFEFKDLSQEGIVAVLNEGGDLLEKLALPTGPEITGINFVSSNNE